MSGTMTIKEEISTSKNSMIETDIYSNQTELFVHLVITFKPKEIEGKKRCLVSLADLLTKLKTSLQTEGFDFELEEDLQADEMNEDCTKNMDNSILAEINATPEFLSILEKIKRDLRYENYGELVKDLIRDKVVAYANRSEGKPMVKKIEKSEEEEFKELKVKISSELLPLLTYLSIERKKTLEEVLNDYLNYELNHAKDQINEATSSWIAF